MKKITFQGEYGAYSHLACTTAYPNLEPIPCRTFESALDDVRAGKSDLAMIPVENSVAGRVADIHYLLGDYDLKIYAEHFQKVEHQLLVKSGVNLNEITHVRSHTMAIGQCQAVIKELGLQTIVMADTAGSAKYISEQEGSKDGAIASKLAAKTYGLEIARENVQDMQHNTTRFLIMSKNLQQKKEDNISYLTSCVFEVRSVPSALYKALGGFATHGVNLTKLESFIVEGDFNKAQFYIDIDGHIEDKSVKGALEELDFYTDKLIVLGVYPMHGYRNQ
jgi:prephenate dehydratase